MATAGTEAVAGKDGFVSKLNVKKVNAKLVAKALVADAGIHADLSTKEAALALERHYVGVTPKADQAVCDVCGAVSNINSSACPFCGVGEDAPADDGEGVEAAAEADAEEEASDAVEAHAAEVVDAAPAEAVPEPATGATKRAAKKAAKEGGTPTGMTRVRGNGASLTVVDGGKSTAIVPAQQLDEDVAEVKRLEREGDLAMWRLGGVIIRIAKTQSWKQRKTPDGKVAYSSFEEFSKKELGIDRTYAENLQKMHKHFSKEDFEKVGPSKLRWVLVAPEEKRGDMLDAARNGASKRDLAKKAKKARKEAGMKPSRPASKREAGTKEITVASIVGKQTVKLWKRNKDAAAKKVAAKRVGDEPWGYIDLANDVRMFFGIDTNGAGDLVLKVDVRREE